MKLLKDAVGFLGATLKTLPYKVHTVLTDNSTQLATVLNPDLVGYPKRLRFIAPAP
ncbi:MULTISPECIES: hypothetical protein [Pseudomonas]|uniref:hypothetical protein n=1 Tax=unclassified Pseudomonas TaxID=196821 RepID=UPI0013CE67FD|nr:MULTISPECIES: hypothetical protein [unclassified Pseudomonas]